MRSDNLPIAALATGVLLLAAEVRRISRERDAARGQFERLVGRLAERPSTVLTSAATQPELSPEPTYVSELPYHDETWDDFVAANANVFSEGEDDE